MNTLPIYVLCACIAALTIPSTATFSGDYKMLGCDASVCCCPVEISVVQNGLHLHIESTKNKGNCKGRYFNKNFVLENENATSVNYINLVTFSFRNNELDMEFDNYVNRQCDARGHKSNSSRLSISYAAIIAVIAIVGVSF